MRFFMTGGALLLCLPLVLTAGEPGRGVRSVALGKAVAALPADAWSVYRNPAQLGFIPGTSFAAFVVPHQYGLAEFRLAAIAASVPLSFAGFGVGIERFGFDLYNETIVQCGFARPLVRDISLGLSLSGKQIAIQGYGARWFPLVDVGVVTRPGPTFLAGAVVRNVLGAAVGRQRERLPQSITSGFSWIPGEDLLLLVEVEKDIRHPILLRIGVERRFFEAASFRAGIASPPRLLTAGMSIRLGSAEFGYAVLFHPELGWTHHIEAGVEVGR